MPGTACADAGGAPRPVAAAIRAGKAAARAVSGPWGAAGASGAFGQPERPARQRVPERGVLPVLGRVTGRIHLCSQLHRPVAVGLDDGRVRAKAPMAALSRRAR